MVIFTLLNTDGNIENREISNRFKNLELNLEKNVKLKGHGKLEELGNWAISDQENEKIIIFGWKNGKNENKHILPPPYDENIYYGDICCCKFTKEKINDLKIEDYEKFYNVKYYSFDNNIISDYSDDDNLSDCMSIDSELNKEEYTDSDDCD